ncbi:MAG: hypothetical protein NUV50_01965 [Rhodospirillales bacterium]|nr:hypothetical protein [Rhodospirillales bacterium]
MVEIFTHIPTGAPAAAPDSTRLRDVSRSHAAQPRVQGSPFSTQETVSNTSSVVAPDVLLAAQQARDTSHPTALNARVVYAFEQPGQQAANKRQSAPKPPNENDGAEIIPLNAKDASANGSFTIPQQGAAPLIIDLNAEASQMPSSFAALRQDVTDFIRANQAYVNAGAADGRTFAASGLDTSALALQQSDFDLII